MGYALTNLRMYSTFIVFEQSSAHCQTFGCYYVKFVHLHYTH